MSRRNRERTVRLPRPRAGADLSPIHVGTHGLLGCGLTRFIVAAFGMEPPGFQRSVLTIYLPADGRLLCAAALLAAGRGAVPKRNALRLLDNGRWSASWGNLLSMP